jgi:hypothetical protein
MSSCSWQLPGQPPSHHSRSPWTVDTARPWAVWAWRLASYRTFWLPQALGRCTRVASPSRHTASPAWAISARCSRSSAKLVMRVPSGWQKPSRPAWEAAGPCCRPPRSWKSRPSGRRAGTTARPTRPRPRRPGGPPTPAAGCRPARAGGVAAGGPGGRPARQGPWRQRRTRAVCQRDRTSSEGVKAYSPVSHMSGARSIADTLSDGPMWVSVKPTSGSSAARRSATRSPSRAAANQDRPREPSIRRGRRAGRDLLSAACRRTRCRSPGASRRRSRPARPPGWCRQGRRRNTARTRTAGGRIARPAHA